jgi:hypothetical protein
MTERDARLGKNEAVFREVNERIRAVTHPPAEAEFLCECSDTRCMQPVAMTLTEYEEVRSDPTHFLLLPGHEVADVDVVVERRTRFTVVEKQRGAAEVAIATDPRE